MARVPCPVSHQRSQNGARYGLSVSTWAAAATLYSEGTGSQRSVHPACTTACVHYRRSCSCRSNHLFEDKQPP